mgnify:CR=1 FL=1
MCINDHFYHHHQVAPAELESLLLKHPAVADAAVVGTPDLEAGELPTAYIVRKDTDTMADPTSEICNFISNQVAHYKRLRGGIVYVENIPKSASGKILRRILRERIKKAFAANM